MAAMAPTISTAARTPMPADEPTRRRAASEHRWACVNLLQYPVASWLSFVFAGLLRLVVAVAAGRSPCLARGVLGGVVLTEPECLGDERHLQRH